MDPDPGIPTRPPPIDQPRLTRASMERISFGSGAEFEGYLQGELGYLQAGEEGEYGQSGRLDFVV
jgi:hypothetical protein